MKKLKMCLCLFLSVAMIFGGTQVWASENIQNTGDGSADLVKIDVSFDAREHVYITAINGEAVTNPEERYSISCPVGTRVSVYADPEYTYIDQRFESNPTVTKVFSWWNASVYVNYEDTTAFNTAFTVTEDMVGQSVVIFAEYENKQQGENQQPDVPEWVQEIQAFVQQLYVNILGRYSDLDGLEGWTDVLIRGEESGAKVAQGFV